MRTERDGDEVARSHYRVGSALYREGRLEQAAQEFERAFALSGRPSLLFNAYLAYRDAGNLARARENLAEYLRLEPEAEDHEVLTGRLRAMEQTLAQQAEEQAVREADRQRLLEERDHFEAAHHASRAEADARARGRGSRAGWAVGGAGLGLVAFSLVPGIVAGRRVSDLEQSCPGGQCPAGFDLGRERTEARRAVIATDAMILTGVAALGTGVVLLLLDRRAARRADGQAGCGPSGCSAELMVRF